jgi:hypothetical protein
VKTSPSTPRRDGPRRRAGPSLGYHARWWGDVAHQELNPPSYWAETRKPLPCLVFVLPMLLAYEVGVGLMGGEAAGALRTGADAWMRLALAAIGLTDRWLPPLALVVALLVWQARDGDRRWRLRPRCLVGMGLESLVLALVLVGMSRVVDRALLRLEDRGPLLVVGSASLARLIGFLGAGVYEETLFRLGLVPLINRLARLVHAGDLLAGTLAVTGSSLLFSIAHHAGMPGEAFTWYAFIFRWLAGVFFAWVFLVRGFGIAVGTHAAYDVLVGWFGWTL